MDEIKGDPEECKRKPRYHKTKVANDCTSYPKGWTGPKVVDGQQIEGSFRAHQVPIMMDKPEHLEMLKRVVTQLPSGRIV